ncbi:MAG: efflux RND transporter permease subunit [Gammaproteobacteria bacterium]|jgi:multidrug efflux pump subunit AcrB|nr:hypothetical protein [Chromatiales bacterium]MDP6673264.1 efflux RND transporter permease subunit [Gammaproteobacteria bacterium]
MISFFARHPVAGNLLMLLMLMMGVYGLTKLNRQVMPNFQLRTISISVQWPGASPTDIEANILTAIEPEVRFLDHVSRVSSTANDSRGQVNIVFDESVDFARALTDVQAAVARITTFPTDIEQPVVTEIAATDLVCQIEISGPYSEQALKFIAKRVRDDLLDLGISSITLRGARDEEIWVEIPGDTLRRLDLTLDDVATRIGQSSLDLPSGSVNSGGMARQIRSKALARTAQDIGRIEVVAAASGEKLHIRDIAHIRETFKGNSISHLQGENHSIGMTLYRIRSADSIEAQRTVTKYIEDIVDELPPNLHIKMFDVFSDQTTQRVRMLVTNGMGGLALVLAVLFFFLNGRVAFWVAMGIPIAVFATLGGMAILGMSLNLMSMFAIVMGLGIIVDDAIVIGEHTEMLHRHGMSPEEATMKAANVMFAPVMAASLTTIAAFMPMLTIGKEIGQILRDLPVTVILVIIASLAECFLVLPMHLKKALHRLNRRSSRQDLGTFREGFIRFRDHRFANAVRLSFEHRYSTVLTAVCAFLIALGLLTSGRVGFEFFPSPESAIIYGNFAMTPGTPRDRTQAMVDEMARAAQVAEQQLTDGKGGIIFFQFGAVGTNEGRQSEAVVIGDHLGSYTLELIPGDHRKIRTRDFVDAWKEEVRQQAGVENLQIYSRNTAGPPGRDIDLRLYGAPLDVLKEVALVVREGIEKIPGPMSVEDNLPYGKQEIIMKMKPAGLAMGFSTQSVARQVRNAFEGAVAKRFPHNQEEVIVRVKMSAVGQPGLESIRELYLRSPAGDEVPLTEVVSLTTKIGYAQIRREDGLRQVSVTADVDKNITTTNAIIATAAQTVAPQVKEKYGIDIGFKGKADEQQAAVADTLIALVIAIVTIYVILAWVFASYTTPFIVMSIIPFGFVGAVFGHWVMGFHVNMTSLQALLGLAGVMINDAIILVASVKRRIDDGNTLSAAIVSGAQERLRPVILTTLTTIGGLTPLLFERSFQAELVQPLAITLIFGLLFSPLLVLFFVPSMLGIGHDLRMRKPGFAVSEQGSS